MIKKRTAVIAAVLLIVFTAAFSSFLTLQISRFIDVGNGDRIVIPKDEYLLNRSFYQKFDRVLSDLRSNYLYETDLNVLLDGAIKGMVESVADDYTRYLNSEEYAEYAEEESPNYEGIGIQVQAREEDNSITVVRVFENGPAAEAGVARGDKLIRVEGKDYTAETMSEAIDIIKGEAGTSVNITLLRGDEEIDVEVMRSVVETPDLEYRMLENNIGYIWLYDFDGNPAKHFIEAVKELNKQGMEALILDLRWNPGGNLNEYCEIADYLLPEGLLITQVNRDGEVLSTRSSDPNHFDKPIAVLCNKYTASAGDLLTAAIQDYRAGAIIGETTFGKGIVQTLKIYSEDSSMLYYTTAEYLTPNGRKIHGIGVTPDIEVEMSEEAMQYYVDHPNDELPAELDNQLQAAISVLIDALSGAAVEE